MADEFNPNNNHNNNQHKQIIDVTKPRNTPPQSSNIDASRVSAYTLREQQSLEKLKKQVGNLNQRENRASSIKTIVAIILVVILIVLAVAFVIIIGRGSSVEEEVTDMRLSVQIENKSTLSVISEGLIFSCLSVKRLWSSVTVTLILPSEIVYNGLSVL